jgi:hypothetical protein
MKGSSIQQTLYLQPLADDPRWLRLLESIGRTPGQWNSVEFEVKLPAQ